MGQTAPWKLNNTPSVKTNRQRIEYKPVTWKGDMSKKGKRFIKTICWEKPENNSQRVTIVKRPDERTSGKWMTNKVQNEQFLYRILELTQLFCSSSRNASEMRRRNLTVVTEQRASRDEEIGQKNKLGGQVQRASGGCLGTRSRWKTW